MRFVLLLACFTLASCAQPTTQLPQVSNADIEAERARQNSQLYDQDFSSLYKRPPYRYEMIERLSSIATRVGPAAIKLCSELRQVQQDPGRACVFDVELGGKKEGFNAHADGNTVIIGPKLLELIPDDDQLAFVMAHEFAHNIMNHIEATRQNATAGAVVGSILEAIVNPYGYRSSSGEAGAELGVLSFSPGFEQEADYVGLYILARAGYKIDKMPEVWRRMAAVNPEGIYIRTTHPTSPERFVAMQKAIEEITSKQHNGASLLPQLAQATTQIHKK